MTFLSKILPTKNLYKKDNNIAKKSFQEKKLKVRSLTVKMNRMKKMEQKLKRMCRNIVVWKILHDK